MSDMIDRVALAKATCSDFQAKLYLVKRQWTQEPLFQVFLRGPVGVELPWAMETADPKGATISELEEHLEELKKRIDQKIEQHACPDCDDGGVCYFFEDNQIVRHSSRGSYDPPGLEMARARIQTTLNLDRMAHSLEDVLKWSVHYF